MEPDVYYSQMLSNGNTMTFHGLYMNMFGKYISPLVNTFPANFDILGLIDAQLVLFQTEMLLKKDIYFDFDDLGVTSDVSFWDPD